MLSSQKSYSGSHVPENTSNCHQKVNLKAVPLLQCVGIDYYSHVETGDKIPDYPHAYNEFL